MIKNSEASQAREQTDDDEDYEIQPGDRVFDERQLLGWVAIVGAVALAALCLWVIFQPAEFGAYKVIVAGMVMLLGGSLLLYVGLGTLVAQFIISESKIVEITLNRVIQVPFDEIEEISVFISRKTGLHDTMKIERRGQDEVWLGLPPEHWDEIKALLVKKAPVVERPGSELYLP
ncbi:MAG: hypothetical protein AAF358_14235 [Pseudomonadota bacterium]